MDFYSNALMRKHQNKKVSKILQEFTGLERLLKVLEYPVERKMNDATIQCDIFAKTLKQIYESLDESLRVDYEKIKDIPLFDLGEMRWALGKMGNSRGADKSDIVVEMVKFAGTAFQNALLSFYNGIISHGEVPENWHVTIFSMLPKSGNLECPSNWRPIAILPIFCTKY